MRTLAEDTSPETERVLIELLRRASPARKVQMITSANGASRELALCGLKPKCSRSAVIKLVTAMFAGFAAIRGC